MPKMKTETFGSGDFRWLGSTHGMRDSRTATIDISAFTKATHYPDGYIRSGTPVNVTNEGAVVPWTDTAGATLGFVLTDQATDGVTDFPAPVLRHGTVNPALVPVTFARPATASAGGFVFSNRTGA